MQAEHLKKPMEEVSSNKDVTGPKILSQLTQTIRNNFTCHLSLRNPVFGNNIYDNVDSA